MRQITVAALLSPILALAIVNPLQADPLPALNDWSFNDDGTTYCLMDFTDNPECDFKGVVPDSLDTSGFDFGTGLGSLEVGIGGAGDHYFGVFLDHEIAERDNTFFNEYGFAEGQPANNGEDGIQTWGLDDPFLFLDLWFGLLEGDLQNINWVPQGGCVNGTEVPDSCHDVGMALAWAFSLEAEESATIRFRVDTSMETLLGDFYLGHVDPYSEQTLYFSSSIDIRTVTVPEPGTLVLLGVGLMGIFAARRRRSAGLVRQL